MICQETHELKSIGHRGGTLRSLRACNSSCWTAQTNCVPQRKIDDCFASLSLLNNWPGPPWRNCQLTIHILPSFASAHTHTALPPDVRLRSRPALVNVTRRRGRIAPPLFSPNLPAPPVTFTPLTLGLPPPWWTTPSRASNSPLAHYDSKYFSSYPETSTSTFSFPSFLSTMPRRNGPPCLTDFCSSLSSRPILQRHAPCYLTSLRHSTRLLNLCARRVEQGKLDG
jgi:hypothetical protein